jgi:hypothetical protein
MFKMNCEQNNNDLLLTLSIPDLARAGVEKRKK